MEMNYREYDAIMAFLYDLQQDGDNFPDHTLRLLAKHFHFDRMSFIPNYSQNILVPVDAMNTYVQTPDVVSYSAVSDGARVMQYYYANYMEKDILHPANLPFRFTQSIALSVDDVMPYEEFLQTEMYRFLRRVGIEDFLDMYLVCDGLRIGAIGFYRSKAHGRFTEREKWIARKICGHIARSYKAAVDSQKDRAELEVYRQGYRGAPVGMMLLDEDFTVLECNARAREYCSDIAQAMGLAQGAVRQGGRLPELTHPMMETIRAASLKGHGADVEFRLEGAAQQYTFSVSHLPVKGAMGAPHQVVSVFISSQPLEGTSPALCQKYELTRREVEVANLVMRGCTNNEISEELFISFHTVKTHLMNIFAKTGARNRTELINRLRGGGVPAGL